MDVLMLREFLPPFRCPAIGCCRGAAILYFREVLGAGDASNLLTPDSAYQFSIAGFTVLRPYVRNSPLNQIVATTVRETGEVFWQPRQSLNESCHFGNFARVRREHGDSRNLALAKMIDAKHFRSRFVRMTTGKEYSVTRNGT